MDSREPALRSGTLLGVRHLRYALAVADAGGFRAAASVLSISQPAITKTVGDIESELGTSLFDRGQRGVVPTDAGRRFLEDARRTLAMFDRTVRSARRNEKGGHGHLVVGYSALATSTGISDGLRAFEALHPEVQVEMHVRSTDSMMRDLGSGGLDIGFLLEHPSVDAPGIAQRPLWSSRIGLVVPVSSPDVGLGDLEGAPLVMGVRENWRSWRALLDDAFVQASFAPCVTEEVWDIQVIFQRIADGRGFTFHPMSAAHSLPASLRILPLPELGAGMTIAMAWSDDADTGLSCAFRAAFPGTDDGSGSRSRPTIDP